MRIWLTIPIPPASMTFDPGVPEAMPLRNRVRHPSV